MDSFSIPSQKLQKLAPVRIFEQAVEQIRELISSGALAVGEKLPAEQELSRQLGVSRSSVREALRVLEAEGSIEIRRGSGAFIATRPPLNRRQGELLSWLAQREETIEQVLEVRETIETLTASLAAGAIAPEALVELRGIVSQQARLSQSLNGAEDAGFADLARLDALFHLAVSSASGNDIAHEIISHLIPAFNESNKAMLYLGGRAQKMESEHRAILAALEAHDAAAAGSSMRTHIQQVRKEILEIRDSRP
ncbi:MAG TPA: GntR family transcriptional regulator [Anaerolineaceae bacterium]|jgi:GntR family transcriptional repressor for pyruvate dehydrogenase complex